MGERREDLSTADLAGQQPGETARRPDLSEEADAERRDDRAPEDLAREDLGRGPALDEDRASELVPDVEEGREPLRQKEGAPAEVATTAQEPAPSPAAQAAPDGGTAGTTTSAGPLLIADDAEAFRARWTDIQNGFVDAPRQAVEQADGLVAELMQHLARTFADERGKLESQWDRGDEVSTDDLRTAFQRYRSFFERLLAT